MSDRASLSVTIYACPPEHREALCALLADADDQEAGTYVWHEEVLGCDETYARDLAAISPQITYQVSQDAKYEFDGRTTIAVPEMGTFTEDLSASGQIIVTREQVLAAVREGGGDLAATLAAVDAAYGGPFIRALAALATRERPAAT